jgi:serine/threonine-protein kinase
VAGGGQFDFSRNGTFVYLSGKSGGGGRPLVWLDSTGKTAPLLATPGAYYGPRLSPDGKLLAFSEGFRDIGFYDAERDRTTRLTFNSQASKTSPVWSPDGKHIVFRSRSAAGASLQWVRADGAGGAQRLMEGKFDLLPYSFSPDGKRLAFAQVSPQTLDIWTLPLDTADPEHPRAGQPELFLGAIAEEYEPAFSPDGRWIAYRTNASGGRTEVYVQPFPGTPGGAGGKWLIGAGRHPVWSRNGREIFYFNPATSRIMVATYTAKGDSFSADKSRVWSDTPILESIPALWNFDLLPDGKRAVVSPRPEAGGQKGTVHVTVLENFFDELRRKMPAGK